MKESEQSEQQVTNNEKHQYFDAHNHLLDFSASEQQIHKHLQQASKHHIRYICPNATHSQEYQRLTYFAKKYPLSSSTFNQLPQPEIQLMARKIQIYPAYGVHPCFLHQEKYDVLQSIAVLKKYLECNVNACVGEIGLDNRKNVLENQLNCKEKQLLYFIKQLELSFIYNRPVTVHCVRAHGEMLKIFKKYNQIIQNLNKNNKIQQKSKQEKNQCFNIKDLKQQIEKQSKIQQKIEQKILQDKYQERQSEKIKEINPPQTMQINQSQTTQQIFKDYNFNPIIMHSYGGSSEITKSLLKLKNLNIYFSLSLQRNQQLCKIIPIDRLILQTDAPYQNNVELIKNHSLFQKQLTGHQTQEKSITIEKEKQNHLSNLIENIRFSSQSLFKYYKISEGQFVKKMFQNTLKIFKILKK